MNIAYNYVPICSLAVLVAVARQQSQEHKWFQYSVFCFSEHRDTLTNNHMSHKNKGSSNLNTKDMYIEAKVYKLVKL